MLLERASSTKNNCAFAMPPLYTLAVEELSGLYIADPFAERSGLQNVFCGKVAARVVSNSLDAGYEADFHMEPFKFLASLQAGMTDAVILVPPVNTEQIYRYYSKANEEMPPKKAFGWKHRLKQEAARVIKKGGKLITVSNDSSELNKDFGFKTTRILLINHGMHQNDSICVVEQKE